MCSYLRPKMLRTVGKVKGYLDGLQLLVLDVGGEPRRFRVGEERWAAFGQAAGAEVVVTSVDGVVLDLTLTQDPLADGVQQPPTPTASAQL